MGTININWRAALVVSLLLFVVLFGLLSAASAQTITPEPTLTPAPPTLPDVGDTIDETTAGLEGFLGSAEIVIAILVWGVTQAIKYITKGSENGEGGDISSTTIYLGVVAVFSIGWIVANLAGYAEQLNSGVAFLTVLADPLWQIIVSLVGSSLIYNTGRVTDNVIMAGRQGETRGAFAEPEPVSLSLAASRDTYISVYPTPGAVDDIAAQAVIAGREGIA